MLRRSLLAFAFHAGLCAVALAGDRVSFIRTIPAEHALRGDHIAVIYAIGDNDQVITFVDVFVERASRGRAVALDDATEHSHLLGSNPDEPTLRRLRREHPADLYLGVHHFTCESVDRAGEGSSYNYEGVREKKQQHWVDTICRARIDVIDGATGRRSSSFDVKGEGTSPRGLQISAEDRKIAAMQAARYAAISAAELITPRQVRESIELDERAPGFDGIRTLIAADRLGDVRQQWELLLRDNGSSAPLHYDLAAVCEALGDVDNARRHYEAALRLAPEEPRYKSELAMFRRRSEPRK